MEHENSDSLLPPAWYPQPVPVPASATGVSRRRWGLRFSLRAFVVLQLLLAVLIGVIVNRIRSIKRQQIILRSIEDGELPMLRYSGGPIKSAWLWEPLCKLADVEPLEVTGVNICFKPLTTADAELLRELPFLRELTLTRGVAEPATMEAVARLRLTRINLHDAEDKHLSDEKIRPLRHCRSLRWLDIHSVNVTNVGLRELATLPNVERLYIQYAKMNIDGLEPWITANRVHDLQLPMRMKSSDCEQLAKFTSLTSLRVYELDEAGARHLVQMPNLRRIQVKEDPRPHVVWKAIDGLPARVQVANRLGIEL